ncbi:MAG TPA: hypothetical protein VHO28_08275 [Ignavibacteriales bacterium]|nr:hypothetical protein [Ignavibacteriales bacterium]HEX3072800.1 hypothetical protein [Ignavibacteriales bacterium]
MKKYILVLVFSTNILAQGINWGLRFDAQAINTTSNFDTHTQEMKTNMGYPLFFSSPQIMFNIYPIKQAGVEIRLGYELGWDDFYGGEYSVLGKYHFYSPLYILCGVTFKDMDAEHHNNNTIRHVDDTFGLLAAGIGGEITKHISAELIYLNGNKRFIEGSERIYTQTGSYMGETHLNYVIKLSAGFNWSIYDF